MSNLSIRRTLVRIGFFSKKGKRPKFSGTPVSKWSKARTTWTHQFVCLADCNGMKVRSTGFEREVLLDAGLGEKITFPDMDCSAEEYRDQVLEAFPKLTEAGGYEMMRCIPNSRVLEPIAASALQSPRATHERVGHSRVYLRPIQKDLDTSSIQELTSNSVR